MHIFKVTSPEYVQVKIQIIYATPYMAPFFRADDKEDVLQKTTTYLKIEGN